VESFALPVSTLHKFDFFEINVIRYLAFQAVSKRRGLYKPALHRKFPCMDAQPAVVDRLFFVREALYGAFPDRNNTVLVVTHAWIPA
jgi:hypothetical protein